MKPRVLGSLISFLPLSTHTVPTQLSPLSGQNIVPYLSDRTTKCIHFISLTACSS